MTTRSSFPRSGGAAILCSVIFESLEGNPAWNATKEEEQVYAENI
jgi:hypothetical protein